MCNFTEEEKKEIIIAIHTRLGYMETGEVMLRARDAESAGMQKKIKALSTDQMRTILLLEGVIEKLEEKNDLIWIYK